MCQGPLAAPAGVAPCWHAFCRACIQRWAASAAAATCPLCRGPIMAIRLLQLEDDGDGVAARRHGRFHPYAGQGPWRQRRQQQQQRGPGGPQRRTLSAGSGERSRPGPRQRVQSPSGQRDRDGHSRLLHLPEPGEDPSWLRRLQEEEPGSGDHAQRFPWLRV